MRLTHLVSLSQVDALVQDALEVLGLVRSTKNNSAPISKISSDVFSLIPGYLKDYEEDKNLITMTHVCHGWRELLIARPSLWTRVNCTNVDKTQVYIERSKSSPLKLSLYNHGSMACLKAALALVIPHISRLKSLTLNEVEDWDILRSLTPYLSRPIPLLSKLMISLGCDPTPDLDTMLFNLSSLCSLSLSGVITHLPWKNLSKLTTFELFDDPRGGVFIAQLLDLFEEAHHLRDIRLYRSIPTMSNAPPGRVVSIPHLKKLTTSADLAHSILLDHLSIPAGASLTLTLWFSGNKSPIPDFLPKSLENLRNIFPISSVNLSLSGFDNHVRLKGPNGGLYMLGRMREWEAGNLPLLDRRFLRSLSCFDFSGTQRLTVTHQELPGVEAIGKSAPYHVLSRMKDLRTLTLIQDNLPFILALNPVRKPIQCAPCPKLEKLVLYVDERESFNIKELMSMAKERASVGMKFSSITVFDLSKRVLEKRVFTLKQHVTHVDYSRVEGKLPRWDTVPGDGAIDPLWG